MKFFNRQRGAQGKHAAEKELLARKVMDLFHVNAVYGLLVADFHRMPEEAKRYMCELLMDVTLCKVPARKGDGMWFFLSKEVAL